MKKQLHPNSFTRKREYINTVKIYEMTNITVLLSHFVLLDMVMLVIET